MVCEEFTTDEKKVFSEFYAALMRLSFYVFMNSLLYANELIKMEQDKEKNIAK